MSKFKVGDVLLCVKSSGVITEGYQYQVTSISPCGWFVRVDGNDSGDLDSNFQLVAPVDELPPAPESVLYVNAFQWGIQANNLGDSLQVGVGDPNSLKHGWTYASLDADTALQLCHDLRRMAMSIKKKERETS